MTDSDGHKRPASALTLPKMLFLRYGLGMLAALLALLVRLPLWVVAGHHAPFLTFYPAIILAAGIAALVRAS